MASYILIPALTYVTCSRVSHVTFRLLPKDSMTLADMSAAIGIGSIVSEMADFQVYVSTSSIRRALISRDWSKKKIGRVAKAQNANLRVIDPNYVTAV